MPQRPEIEHFDPPVLGDHDVRRFQVAMDDTQFVCAFE